MKKIGIFYGSSTGMTAEVAQEIAKLMGVDEKDVHDVARSAPPAIFRTTGMTSSTDWKCWT